MFKDFFGKPLSVVAASDIQPGDFIHRMCDRRRTYEREKQRGFVRDAGREPHWGTIILLLVNRKSALAVRPQATAIVTRKDNE